MRVCLILWHVFTINFNINWWNSDRSLEFNRMCRIKLMMLSIFQFMSWGKSQTRNHDSPDFKVVLTQWVGFFLLFPALISGLFGIFNRIEGILRFPKSQICSINYMFEWNSTQYLSNFVLYHVLVSLQSLTTEYSINWQTICQMILKLMSFVFPTFNVKSDMFRLANKMKKAKTMLLVT